MGFHEVIPADENARFERYAQELAELQRKSAASGSLKRALHVKQHLGVVAEWKTLGGGPGVFREARTYQAYVRFSNGSFAHKSDRADDQRGFAVKLVGVEGKKIIPGLENKKTQDFLFIASPALPVRNPDEFMAFVRSAKDGPAKILPRMIKQLGVIRTIQIARAGSKQPKVSSFATSTFHTGAPIAWGDTAAKLALVPQATSPSDVDGDDRFRDDLIARLRQGSIVYSVRAQKFVDDATTPIEDASVPWPADKAPFVEVATLTVVKQDPTSAAGKQIDDVVSTLSFDPWHAVEDHRPLGAVMRARAVAYRESVLARKAADEPESVLSPG